MSEIVLRVKVPSKMEPEFRSALKKVVARFIDDVEYCATKDLLSKSTLTEKQAAALAREAKKGIARRHAFA